MGDFIGFRVRGLNSFKGVYIGVLQESIIGVVKGY